MLRNRHELGHKLKKTMSEIDAMPWGEFISWLAFYEVRAKERERALKKR